MSENSKNGVKAPGENPISDERLARLVQLRQQLEGRRDELQGRVGTNMADLCATDTGADYVAASSLESESVELREIGRALERLQQGTYGRCIECLKPIRAERLEYVPHAPHCVSCQKQADAARASGDETFSSRPIPDTDRREGEMDVSDVERQLDKR